ncbi:MAG: 5'/3'-nucleotidase SurE [Alphaproteobacteria bacterium]|nr:5'/3'-nucleotidase SurE [Alphaproteobacteria bacterium]
MKQPLDLATARILLTNDDGVDAPGLKLLAKLVRRMAADVWIVAPETEQSASGHSLTLRRPLRLRKLSARRYAVDGTPTDAVLLAVMELLKDRPPDLVLSGINRGGNMGEDVTYSGTVSAAMEATLLGVPAVALSQDVRPGGKAAWGTSAAHLPDVLARLAAASWPRQVFINVNVPDVAADAVTGVRVVTQGRRKPGGALAEGRDPRGLPYYWIATTRAHEHHLRDSDLDAVYQHQAIAVTPMHLDLTHRPTLGPLGKVFR